MPEWFNPERGYYIAKYRGRTLEVVRNKDATDKRRYVAQVDGVILPHPCHTIPQAKTKAMKWADSPSFYEPVEHDPPFEHPPPDGRANSAPSEFGAHAVIPYVDPNVPALTGVDVMIAFTITGKIPASQFAANVSNLQAAVDMLREVGGEVECSIKPPGKVKL